METESEVPSRKRRRRASLHVVFPTLCSSMPTIAASADVTAASSSELYSSQLRPDSPTVTLTEKKVDEVGASDIVGSRDGGGDGE